MLGVMSRMTITSAGFAGTSLEDIVARVRVQVRVRLFCRDNALGPLLVLLTAVVYAEEAAESLRARIEMGWNDLL